MQLNNKLRERDFRKSEAREWFLRQYALRVATLSSPHRPSPCGEDTEVTQNKTVHIPIWAPGLGEFIARSHLITDTQDHLHAGTL